MYGTKFMGTHKLLSASWALECFLMGIFTLLPANKVEDLNMMYDMAPDV
jgi:phosphatidylinositol glycan class N